MKTASLNHILIAVRDMEQVLSAWQETFGLRPGSPPGGGPPGPFQPEGSEIELAILPVGDMDRQHPFVELVRPTEEEHSVARHLAERGEGMASVAVEVDDLDAAVRELREKGVAVSGPEPRVLGDGRVARIPGDSAHGAALHLIERARA